MSDSNKGFLFIADITGYTAFLNHSELEHARDSLGSLLDLLIENTKLPLVVSRLEGDAVISYSLEGTIKQGQTVVEMIETTYVSFRKAIELMVLNTNCTCNACQNIQNLDLKFFVHYGIFMLQPLASYTELIGADVNLIHKLAKNTITENFGSNAYVVYTKAAVEALKIEELAEEMSAHTEKYEQFGEVDIVFMDMHAVWESEKAKIRVFVKPEDALLYVEREYPIPLGIVWDAITRPEYKEILAGDAEIVVKEKTNGRVSNDSVFQCVHGGGVLRLTIVDWQPLNQYTEEYFRYKNAKGLLTYRVEQIEGGTKLSLTFNKAVGKPQFVVNSKDKVFAKTAVAAFEKNLENLEIQLEKEISGNQFITMKPIEISKELISEAIEDSLAN
ncbi:MAG: DUF2652 domain-containing protein [Chloroflexi bacterium]|nr:DUF2652 domain-containing protein [Chloroflexota bacterium]